MLDAIINIKKLFKNLKIITDNIKLHKYLRKYDIYVPF